MFPVFKVLPPKWTPYQITADTRNSDRERLATCPLATLQLRVMLRFLQSPSSEPCQPIARVLLTSNRLSLFCSVEVMQDLRHQTSFVATDRAENPGLRLPSQLTVVPGLFYFCPDLSYKFSASQEVVMATAKAGATPTLPFFAPQGPTRGISLYFQEIDRD